jgi:hypothetical protein
MRVPVLPTVMAAPAGVEADAMAFSIAAAVEDCFACDVGQVQGFR